MGMARGFPYMAAPTPQAACTMSGAFAWRVVTAVGGPGWGAGRRRTVLDGVGPGAMGARYEPRWAWDVAVPLSVAGASAPRSVLELQASLSIPFGAVACLGLGRRRRSWAGWAVGRALARRTSECAMPIVDAAHAPTASGRIGRIPEPSHRAGVTLAGCRVELEVGCFDDDCTWLFHWLPFEDEK